MADTIARIYFNAYETNFRLGKVLLTVFVLLYVAPLVLLSATSLLGPASYVSFDTPSRAQGVLNTRDIGAEFGAIRVPSGVYQSPYTRANGLWSMRSHQVIPVRPTVAWVMPETMPSRAKGVLNMRMGGIF